MNERPDNTDYRSLLENAFLELRGLRSELEAIERSPREPIAIIGMGCRLPKVRDLQAFWQLLCEGRSVITEVPAERWEVDELFDPDANSKGKTTSRWGGFLEDLDSFDAPFFSISSREAPHVDPRQRVLLEVAWEALEDAGIDPFSLTGSKTGVYVATLRNDYDFLISEDYSLYESFTGPGTANSIVANRISYFLDLKGPSLTLDTACSGSLLGVELACRSLLSNETTLALAGGVSVNLLPGGDVFFSRAGALSPDGCCRAFDGDANGIVRSEGAGMIVLKRLSAALANGDRIYGLIRGGAINHNGRSNGLMAPNGLAQEELLREAYKQAGVSPGKVQYVEGHGTGTRLGDPIEVNSLAEVLATERAAGRPCALGSVKTNVGHLEAAAGVVGVIKTALSLYHRQIPPTLHFTQLNPLISDRGFPLHVAQELESWPVEDEPLIAGVSSFGFGGTNAHLVLEEAPRADRERGREIARTAHVLPLSAQSAVALRSAAESYQKFLLSDTVEQSLSDICYTASVRRGFHDYRLAVAGRSREELVAELEAFTSGEKTRNVPHSVSDQTEPRRLVYVFSGQGTHWRGMGCQLMEAEPVFYRSIQECERLLSDWVDWSLTEQLRFKGDESRLNETDVAQPAIFAVQVALAALWRSWGIVPDVVVGQSLGEVAAAHVAGALSLEDALQVVFQRSRLMKKMAGQGRTAVVGLSALETQRVLADFVDTLTLAGSLSPTTSVISGEGPALEHVLQLLRSRDVFWRTLENGELAFHSPQMDGIKPELTQALETIGPTPTSIRFVSTVTGATLQGQELDADYWGRNLREPFRLADVITSLIEGGYCSFLEISPHPAIASSIRQCLAHQGRKGIARSSLVRDQDERLTMLSSLAGFYEEGVEINWKALYPAGGRCVSLPCYPWQRERYWYDQLSRSARAKDTSVFASRRKMGCHPLLGEHFQPALSTDQQFWERDFSVRDLPYLKDHRVAGAIVVPGAAFLEMALAAANQAPGGSAGSIEHLSFNRALMLSEHEPLKLQLVCSTAATGEASFQIYSRPTSEGNQTNSWTLHASGRMCPPAEESSFTANAISLEESRSNCPHPVSIDDHYAAMEALQLHYGPGFRALEQLWSGEGEAVSRCALKESAGGAADSYQAHPVLLDSAFQTVAAASPLLGEVLYLPQSITKVRMSHRLGDHAWAHAILRPNTEPGASVLIADIRLFDDDGRVAGEIEGLCLRRFDAVLQTRIHNSQDWLYQVQWVPSAQTGLIGRKSNDGPATYLVFTDGGEIGETFAAILERDSKPCIKIYPARQYRISHDKRSAWIDPHHSEHFQRLFRDVLTDEVQTPIAVVHLWGMTASAAETTCAGFEASQVLGCEALLHITQALPSPSAHNSARLWVATNRTQSAGASATNFSFAQSGLWGLGRVVALEHQELWGGLVDLDLADPQSNAELLYQEISQRSGEREVAFRAGERHVARLKRIRLPATTPSYQFRLDASYLITGGLSGLGLETARWMVRRGARRLILLARTQMPPRKNWSEIQGTAEAERVAAVRELERMGASVQVYAVDVGDEIQLRTFFENYRSEGWPQIRGVVHSAGIVKDQLLMRMDVQSFREVLKPKLYGAWLLHCLTQPDELDFFVMFSSVASLLPRAGQANYAAANAGLDGLAHYRRSLGLAALSINWGPWSEVGMYARMGPSKGADTEGMAEINPEIGAELFSLLIGRAAGQVVALNADWTRFKASPLLSELMAEPADGDVEISRTSANPTVVLEMLLAGEAERRAMLEEYIKKILGQVLRCDASRANKGTVLASLGMDSIMAVELKNAIEADLHLNISLPDLFTESVFGIVEKLDQQLRADERLAAAVAEIEQLSQDEVFAQLSVSED